MSLFVFIIFAGLFHFLFILKQAIEKGLSQTASGEKQKEQNTAFPEEKQTTAPSFAQKSPKAPKVAFAWTWMQCAGKYNLRYLRQGSEELYPAIEGEIDQHDLRIEAIPAPDGKTLDTVMTVSFPPAGLCLYLDGKRNRKEEDFPTEDISGYFENRILRQMYGRVLKGKGELFRQEYAVPCEKFLLKHLDSCEDFILSDSSFRIRFKGTENEPELLEEKIEFLVDAGQFFGSLSEHIRTCPARSVSVEERTGPAAAVPEKEILCRAPDNIPPPPTTEVKTFPQVAPAVPVSPSVPSAPSEIPAPLPAPEKAEISSPAEVEVPPSGDLRKETVAGDLWRSSFPGAAEKTLFETRYKGKEVCWEGTLRGAFAYNFDIVFGQQSGVKATVELLEIAQGNSSFKVKIKALISFSPEEAALLRNSSGKQILFQGKLLKYEALSRELYLSGGRILSIGE